MFTNLVLLPGAGSIGCSRQVAIAGSRLRNTRFRIFLYHNECLCIYWMRARSVVARRSSISNSNIIKKVEKRKQN